MKFLIWSNVSFLCVSVETNHFVLCVQNEWVISITLGLQTQCLVIKALNLCWTNVCQPNCCWLKDLKPFIFDTCCCSTHTHTHTRTHTRTHKHSHTHTHTHTHLLKKDGHQFFNSINKSLFNLIWLIKIIILVISAFGEASAAHLKSLADRQQSAKYSRQLPSWLCGQCTQEPLTRTYGYGAILLA